MSVNTLDIYKNALKAGFSEEQAIIVANNSDTILNHFKDEFANQKMVSILGGLILLALTGITGELWVLSKDVSCLGFRMSMMAEQISDLNKRVASIEEKLK